MSVSFVRRTSHRGLSRALACRLRTKKPTGRSRRIALRSCRKRCTATPLVMQLMSHEYSNSLIS